MPFPETGAAFLHSMITRPGVFLLKQERGQITVYGILAGQLPKAVRIRKGKRPQAEPAAWQHRRLRKQLLHIIRSFSVHDDFSHETRFRPAGKRGFAQYEMLTEFPFFVISMGRGQAFPSGSRRMTFVFFV